MGSLLKILEVLAIIAPPLERALTKAIDAFTEPSPKLGPPPKVLDLDAERDKVLAKKP